MVFHKTPSFFIPKKVIKTICPIISCIINDRPCPLDTISIFGDFSNAMLNHPHPQYVQTYSWLTLIVSAITSCPLEFSPGPPPAMYPRLSPDAQGDTQKA